jgi:hypothetical protein
MELRTMARQAVYLAAFSLLFSQAHAQATFTEVAKQSGINIVFGVLDGSFGGGATAFDFNNDGFEDLFITGGANDDGLYLNKGNGTFENVYNKSGLRTKIKYITQGVISADVNKDGWRDLFITTITTSVKAGEKKIPRAPNLLFINNGNGTFRDATTEYGLDKYQSFSTGAMFGDVNEDGYPDIYVGNYFDEFSSDLRLTYDAMLVGSKEMAKGFLLINEEGKHYTNEYEEYGLKYKGFGFGGVFTDFDNDHDLDLLVNHDFGYKGTPNKFLENKYPEKKFEDVGAALKMDLPINAMGTAVGDYNNDGLLDYFVTNIKGNMFMVNQGIGKPFVDLSSLLGTRFSKVTDKNGSYMPVSWGANFADFDNDGDLDLFVANGCLNPYVEPNPDYYFENVNGRYENKSGEKNMGDYGVSRGSIVFDYDNDGDLDLLVVNETPVTDNFANPSSTLLYRNDSPSGNWLKVELAGVDNDKNGIGCRVEVTAGALKMIREIDGGSSHLSQNSTIAHFGLGSATKVDTVRVTWLGGKEQILVNQKANQLLKITENNNHGRESHSSKYWWFAVPVVLLVAFVIFRSRRSVANKKSI